MNSNDNRDNLKKEGFKNKHHKRRIAMANITFILALIGSILGCVTFNNNDSKIFYTWQNRREND
jgi:UDP-N-acetylmuramyl pentapeptide phosphotransferase/UDP-N-acetylglucosamine-1-phosphate transferase